MEELIEDSNVASGGRIRVTELVRELPAASLNLLRGEALYFFFQVGPVRTVQQARAAQEFTHHQQALPCRGRRVPSQAGGMGQDLRKQVPVPRDAVQGRWQAVLHEDAPLSGDGIHRLRLAVFGQRTQDVIASKIAQEHETQAS